MKIFLLSLGTVVGLIILTTANSGQFGTSTSLKKASKSVNTNLLTEPYLTEDPNLQTALEAVTLDFRMGLEELELAIANYQRSSQTHNQVAIRHQHAATRIAFKKVEYLLEYIDPTSIKKYINGAPLPKTEPKVPEVVIIEPSGLQRLDELVMEDEPDYIAIATMTAKLAGNYSNVHTYAKHRQLQHYHIFEAMRLELVRMLTLGVSGFDTPASGAALPETLATLLTIHDAYKQYSTSVKAKDAELDQVINNAFEEGVWQLSGANFNTFDRFGFLTKVVNPLTRSLNRAQSMLDIEFRSGGRNPLNPKAEQLFASDWLNADVYAKLPKSEYEAARIELGKLLFFDPILSSNNKRACASCHHPDKAFTDGRSRSLAIDGKGNILRNSPTLINSVYAEKFFSDLREERLDRQIKHVVHDSLEFNTDFVEIAEKLKQSSEYVALFTDAYPEYPAYSLSRYSISDALGRYIKNLSAHNSPFDQMARNERVADIEVQGGFNLFMGKAACGTCHFPPTFSGLVPPYYRESESEVLGVPAKKVWENASIDADLGRIVNGKPEDEAYFNAFAFKTPTVRNVSLTAPYMHNGVFTTLEEVMNFYNLGGGAGIGSYVDHQTLPPDALGLNEQEIKLIITFMEALVDTTNLVDIPLSLPNFSENDSWNLRQIGGDY